MAQPVMYAAWCRPLLAIPSFGLTALAAARAALLASTLLVASPVMPASPTSMSAPIAYPETRRVDVVDDGIAGHPAR